VYAHLLEGEEVEALDLNEALRVNGPDGSEAKLIDAELVELQA
jgi:hypothetical protein